MDVVEWLRAQGLEQYAPAFRQNDIGADLLPTLNADDLKELGVASLGHRRRLLQAIAALHPMPDATPPAALNPGPRAEPEAERRQVTIMFCDLVGSTALASRLDPEDLRDVFDSFRRRVAQVVAHFDGFVAKYMGDGVLAYFGYPHAHEDDAEQAVRAALALIDAVGELQAPQRLQVRIGIATGLVVIGDLIGAGSAQEQVVVGETPNLAARMQTLAEPNVIVIAESTHRQIGARFEVADLGPQSLKGFTEPQRAWRVLAEKRALGRYEALRSGATPLIGRDEELDLLLRRWAQAKPGSGRVVLISAEPGVGKSRIAEALAERIAGEPHIRLRYFCSLHHQDSALYPVVAQMEHAAGFAHEDSPGEKLAKLQALLIATAPPREDVALIAELHSLASADAARPFDVSPQRKKEETFDVLLRQIERLSRQQPVLMVFEDIHWIDPSSRELLDWTFERIVNWPVLLVATFRPEFQSPWTGQPHVTTLNLTRLDRHDTATMVANIAGSEALPADIVQEIAVRTEGVPLFVEELTKAVLEAGTQAATTLSSVPHPALSVPATLHASLMARLDRLGPVAKDVAQKGGVIGRDFRYDLLASITDLPEPQLREALDRLTNSGLLFTRGTPPQSTYIFKHSLVQDTAYGSLLNKERQQVHRRVGEAIRHWFPERAETGPEVVAYHCAQADLIELAVEWWGKAGELAQRRSAYIEAISHFEKALSAAERLGGAPVQQVLRLRLQIAYGNALRVARGFGAPETIAAFACARDLAASIEGGPDRFPAYYGLWSGSFLRGQLTQMQEIAEAFLSDIESQPDSPEAGIAHRIYGMTCWFQGNFAKARAHLEKTLAICESARDRELVFRFGQDVATPAMSYLALVLWPLGLIDHARQFADAAVTCAMRTKHMPTVAYAHAHTSTFEMMRHDRVAAEPHVQSLLQLAHKHGMPVWTAFGTFHQGWLRWHAGDREAGTAGMHEGMALMRAQRQEVFKPMLATLLAETEAEAGQLEAALAILDYQLVEIEQTGQHWLDAEVHRARGNVLLRLRPCDSTAESAFTRAIDIARNQSAKLFELRATLALARLWAVQGKRAEAHDLLAPAYDWFTEGFDAADLVDAKALLNNLETV
jgi:class 3 adenylate cyclase/predicted ATPase